MITGGDLRQSRLDVGYKTFTISPWSFERVTQPTDIVKVPQAAMIIKNIVGI